MNQEVSKILRLKREGLLTATQTLRAVTAALTGGDVSSQLPDAANFAYASMHARATSRTPHKEAQLRFRAQQAANSEDPVESAGVLADILKAAKEGTLHEPQLFARWLPFLVKAALTGLLAGPPRKTPKPYAMLGIADADAPPSDRMHTVVKDIVRDTINDAILASTLGENTDTECALPDNVIDLLEAIAERS